MSKRYSDYLREKEKAKFRSTQEKGREIYLSGISSEEHSPILPDWEKQNHPLKLQITSRSCPENQPGIRDFSQESRYRIFPWLIHRYPDRVVVLASNRCFAYCRFCFRQDFLAQDPFQIGEEEIKTLIRYLKVHPEVKEVIISGGDPLTLSDSILKKLIEKLGKVEHLTLLRLATRGLSFFPERFNSELVNILKEASKPIWLVSHFNHHQELTSETQKAISLLRKAGIPTLNQTVLLKGVNNSSRILSQLFSRLTGMGIKPYYLFQCDPVPGAIDFATPLEESFQIMNELSQLSGLALPRFALELPGYGKLSFFAGWKIQREKEHYLFISPWGKTYLYPQF